MYWTTGAYSVTVNGYPQFRDANPGAGIANGTVFNADWGNMITNEGLNLVKAAGLTPSDTDATQLLKAIRVLAGFGANGQTVVSGNTTLTAAELGTLVVFNGSSAATVTLPATSVIGDWLGDYVISNQGSALLTIAVPTGETINGPSATPLAPGQNVVLRNGGSGIWESIAVNPAKPQAGTKSAAVTGATGNVSLTITAPYDCLIDLKASAGTGGSSITSVSLSQSGGTFVQPPVNNWANGSTLGVSFGTVEAAAGASVTITFSVVATASDALTPALSYLIVPN